MKKYNKIFIISAIIIIILGISLFFFKKDKTKIKKDLISEYSVAEFGYELTDYIVKDKEIYYLLREIGTVKSSNELSYMIGKMDIESNKKTKISEVKLDTHNINLYENNGDIYVYSSSIEENNRNFKLYDINFKVIDEYSDKLSSEAIGGFEFINYSDKLYLSYDFDDYIAIYSYENKKITEVKKIGFDCVLASVGENEYCLLDKEGNKSFQIDGIINKYHKEYKKENEYLREYSNYENGYFGVVEDKIYVYDIKNNRDISYDNVIDDIVFTESYSGSQSNLLDKDNERMIRFSDNKINVYNLKNNTLDYSASFDNIYLFGGKIVGDYAYFYNYEKIYLLDLKKIDSNQNKVSVEKITEEQKNKVLSKKEQLENDYNVKIFIDNEAVANSKSAISVEKVEVANNYFAIDASLDKIKSSLEIFKKDFFDKFYHDKCKGLEINLVGSIVLENDFYPDGFTFDKGNIIDVTFNLYNLDSKNFVHEMWHALEYNIVKMENDGKGLTEKMDKWWDFNPSWFFNYENNYSNYLNEEMGENTLDESDKNEVYFINGYSKIDDYEDRATIFETLYLGNINFREYPNLYKKAKWEEEMISKYYPSLKESEIFANL